ncbi:hypothetical protein [Cohnella rhizosphaerae]|uniref:Uncharacterized protein n=1 Tax=Cohnella rhizosphaerae TaxID=1457232 RepID=A0A9X4QTQ9_9BACL|nr:hypothetical protein [Cohnella rhizosphaerae]MDG0810643.1 hypothetical protein [Cohnella rhizosphaerae]
MVKMNSFAKVNILILILLVPLLTLYMISNRTSVSVLERHIRESQMDRLNYLYKQLDNNVNQLSMMANMLLRDPTVKEFRDMELYENDMNYNALKTVQTISQKLMLQSVANAFTNSVVIYAPKIGKAVGQSSLVYYDAGDIAQRALPDWRYDAARDRFVMYAFDPISERGACGECPTDRRGRLHGRQYRQAARQQRPRAERGRDVPARSWEDGVDCACRLGVHGRSVEGRTGRQDDPEPGLRYDRDRRCGVFRQLHAVGEARLVPGRLCAGAGYSHAHYRFAPLFHFICLHPARREPAHLLRAVPEHPQAHQGAHPRRSAAEEGQLCRADPG